MPEPTALPQYRQRSSGESTDHAKPAIPAGHQPVRSLYIHIPFCYHKCHYCDFYSIVDSRDRQGVFTDRLIDELTALAPHAGPLETIFVGGGTPTLLREGLWRRLLDSMHERFDLTATSEFTVECNPETASPELFDTLVGGGVNRISIGAQSFNPTHLKTLERWHDPASVPRAIELARAAGIDRQSLDLIYAIPGQTLTDLDADLDALLALGVTHASCYNLTYEPNTAMTVRMKRAEFEPAPEDLEITMFERVADRLAAAGLHRYEVSNFAQAGHECAHNLAYWRQRDWLAAGPSASAHVAGARWKNAPRLDDYINSQGLAPVTDYEPPDPARNLAETIMTGLRLAEGLDAPSITARAQEFDPAAPARIDSALTAHRRAGHLTADTNRWKLTTPGFLVADGIAAELMDAVNP